MRHAPAVALAAAVLALAGCGGETGQQAEDAVRKRASEEIDRAEKAGRRAVAKRAKQEIDRLQREAERAIRQNAPGQLEKAAERAKDEVDKAAR